MEKWKKNLPSGQSRTTRVRPRFRVLDYWIIFKVWMTVTLQPFDLQRLTVPLWKDLDPFDNIASAQETDSILKIGFALSKWPNYNNDQGWHKLCNERNKRYSCVLSLFITKKLGRVGKCPSFSPNSTAPECLLLCMILIFGHFSILFAFSNRYIKLTCFKIFIACLHFFDGAVYNAPCTWFILYRIFCHLWSKYLSTKYHVSILIRQEMIFYHFLPLEIMSSPMVTFHFKSSNNS